MGAYRPVRNYETSTKDYLETNLNTDWTSPTVNVYRGWSEISGINLPCITIRSGLNTHERAGLGSFATIRQVTLLIDIFATGEGQLLDLKDYLVGLLKKSWNYKEYTVTNGVSSSVTNGRIVCVSLNETIINFDVNKSDLDKTDRHRALLTVVVRNSKVEI